MYKEVEVKEVLDVKVTAFNSDGIHAEVYLSISNPNPYKLKLTESSIDLVLDGKSLGQVVLEAPMEIPAKSVSTQVMKVNTGIGDISSLLGNVLDLFFKSEFVLEGKGYVKGKVLFVSRKVPVSFKHALSKKDLGF